MPKSISVTGASGLIGGALIRELVSRDVDVTAVSRRPSRTLTGVTVKTIESYRETPVDPKAIVVHLAELALIGEAEKRGCNYISEVTGRVSALLEKNFARIVYVSSGSVYATDGTDPRSPSDRATPDSIYAKAKIAAEELVLDSGGAVARLSNVYGSPLKPGTVISDILNQLPGTAPVVVRDDNPARDYLWLGDAARGLADIALGEATGLFNLGSGTATSATEIARIALAVWGERDRDVIATIPKREGKIDAIALDCSKTTANFGWRPSTTLADGIRMVLAEER
jgi:nucleoside-diphosphate-sugar epimerase